jgi:hypothetical protein
MDVYCANCGEPWDLHHLLHDEVHDTAAGTDMVYDRLDLEDWDKKMRSFSSLSRREFEQIAAETKPEPRYKGEPWERKLTPFWREQFERLGWKFGTTVSVVLHCTCCKSNGALPDAAERVEDYETVDSCLGDDLDGAAVTIADLEEVRRHG